MQHWACVGMGVIKGQMTDKYSKRMWAEVVKVKITMGKKRMSKVSFSAGIDSLS